MSIWNGVRSELFGRAAQRDHVSSVPPEMSDQRTDFIKRLFAVTISVGFANQLSHFTSTLGEQTGAFAALRSITPSQWESLALLATSLIAVVASWEGYLISIHRDPLHRSARFYLDVVIVFVYLLLMLLSSKDALWFAAFALMFLVYLIWDVVKILDRKRNHEDRCLYERSWVITFVWFLATCGLYHFKSLNTSVGFSCASLSALSIIVLYRVDKLKRVAFIKKICFLVVPALFLYFGTRLR